MPTQTIAADLLARRLAEAGCRRAWGMPGGEVLTLVDALERAGIEVLLARHENAAAFMAEGDWHMTGAPGILIATLGPGILNAVNAVANALQDRVPLIALSGCVDATEALTYTHQILDHRAVLAPVTKASFRLTAEGADTVADKAVTIALEPRPGPVHVDVPISVAGQAVDGMRLRRRPEAAPTVPAPSPALDTALRWLADAERPVIIAGLDVMNEGSGPALKRLAERLGAPVITSYKAKGVIDEAHPLALGGAGLSPLADSILVPFMQDSDLVLCAGYDPVEMRSGWREVWDPARLRVIDVAAQPNHHYMHQAGINFVGHVGATLDLFASALDGDRPPRAGIEGVRKALSEAFPRDEVWGAAAVIDELERACPPGTVATVDSGAHRILLSQMWRCRAPRTLLQSTAFCTMGPALPLAIGARRAAPDKPVVAIMGDAGFLMVAGELSSALDLGTPIVALVLVDASLALIEKKQRARQLANAAVDFGRHDIAAIARGFGGRGLRAGNRDELRAALADAFADPAPFTVIAAEIPRQAYDNRI